MDKKDFLKLCLEEKNKLPMEGVKVWEFAIQQAIEKVCPDKQWYDVTKVSIFNELLSGKLPVDVCEMVWKDVERELSLKDKNVPLAEKMKKAEDRAGESSVKGVGNKNVNIEIVRDFENTYCANISINNKRVTGLPEYVDYRTLKNAVKEKCGLVLPTMKELKFERVGRKYYAHVGKRREGLEL